MISDEQLLNLPPEFNMYSLTEDERARYWMLIRAKYERLSIDAAELERLSSYDHLAGSLIGICQSLLSRLEEPSGCCTNSNTAYVREIREVLNELFTLKAKGEEARRK